MSILQSCECRSNNLSSLCLILLFSAAASGPPAQDIQALEVRLTKIIDAHMQTIQEKIDDNNHATASTLDTIQHELRSEVVALVGAELGKERERSKTALADAMLKVEAYQQRMVKWLFESALEAQLNEWIHDEVQKTVDERIGNFQGMLQEGLRDMVDDTVQRAARVALEDVQALGERVQRRNEVMEGQVKALGAVVYEMADEMDRMKRGFNYGGKRCLLWWLRV